METNGRPNDNFSYLTITQRDFTALNVLHGKIDRRVELALALLIKNQKNRRLFVTDLAAHVRLSPSRLRQLFRREMGISPAKYMRMLRLESAKSLLEGSLLSVKEIVGEVGYGDVSHFVRDYRIRYKVRPSEARSLSSGLPIVRP